MISFHVIGKPITQGSKQAFVPTDKAGNPYRKNGRIVTSVVDDNRDTLLNWRNKIADAADKAIGGARPFYDKQVAVIVAVLFLVKRPQAHYGTGRNSDKLKATAPQHPTTWRDVDKLKRAVCDAMSEIVYVDDSQVCLSIGKKCYSNEFGAAIWVSELTEQTAVVEAVGVQQHLPF